MKTEITLRDVAFKSQESDYRCLGCAFFGGEFRDLCDTANELQKCYAHHRADEKNVIWVRA